MDKDKQNAKNINFQRFLKHCDPKILELFFERDKSAISSWLELLFSSFIIIGTVSWIWEPQCFEINGVHFLSFLTFILNLKFVKMKWILKN